MSREYLFRGKRRDTGKWVVGPLINKDYILQYIDLAESWEPGTSDHKVTCRAWEIIPETVGQYIGIKGYTGEYETRKANEVKLWEGDIVEARSEGAKGIFVIKWRQQSAPTFTLYPAWQSRKMWNIHGSDVGRKAGDYFDDLCVIGNIHDNPELIKTAS